MLLTYLGMPTTLKFTPDNFMWCHKFMFSNFVIITQILFWTTRQALPKSGLSSVYWYAGQYLTYYYLFRCQPERQLMQLPAPLSSWKRRSTVSPLSLGKRPFQTYRPGQDLVDSNCVAPHLPHWLGTRGASDGQNCARGSTKRASECSGNKDCTNR